MANENYELKTVNGHTLKEVASALQKCLRRSHKNEAMYFAVELVESGFIKYLHYRLTVIAHEDLGYGSPHFVKVVSTLSLLGDLVKEKKERFDWKSLVATVILLTCESSKSRRADNFANYIIQKRKAGMRIGIPDFARDSYVKTTGEKRGNKFWIQISSKVHPEVGEGELGFDDYKVPIESVWLNQADKLEPDWEEDNFFDISSRVKTKT